MGSIAQTDPRILIFLDTNVLIYAFDPKSPLPRRKFHLQATGVVHFFRNGRQ